MERDRWGNNKGGWERIKRPYVEPKETCMIGEDDEPEDDAICTTYVD